MRKRHFWDSVEDRSVVCPSKGAVAVYLNEDNWIVIRQEDQNGEDAIVIIERSDMNALIRALRQNAKEASRLDALEEGHR